MGRGENPPTIADRRKNRHLGVAYVSALKHRLVGVAHVEERESGQRADANARAVRLVSAEGRAGESLKKRCLGPFFERSFEGVAEVDFGRFKQLARSVSFFEDSRSRPKP